MKNVLAAASLFALVGCASSGAIAQDTQCSWPSATWDTSWAGQGEAFLEAPMTLRAATPAGDIEGTWGDPVAGAVWGRIVGPDQSTVVGEWGPSREAGAYGAFLLHITAPSPEHPQSCRFEGVYTGSAGQPPLRWFGQRRRLVE